MSKVLVDRELLEQCVELLDLLPESRTVVSMRELLAQPAEAEGAIQRPASHPAECYALGTHVVHASLVHGIVRQADELNAALSAVTAELTAAAIAYRIRGDVIAELTAERDRLREAAGKAIAWFDAEQNESGVGINRRIKLCRDAENSLRAAIESKEG